jgi:hypothetical protein
MPRAEVHPGGNLHGGVGNPRFLVSSFGREGRNVNVTLGPEVAEILHARLPSLGKAISEATIPASAGPKKPLPIEPEKITVEGTSIQP